MNILARLSKCLSQFRKSSRRSAHVRVSMPVFSSGRGGWSSPMGRARRGGVGSFSFSLRPESSSVKGSSSSSFGFLFGGGGGDVARLRRCCSSSRRWGGGWMEVRSWRERRRGRERGGGRRWCRRRVCGNDILGGFGGVWRGWCGGVCVIDLLPCSSGLAGLHGEGKAGQGRAVVEPLIQRGEVFGYMTCHEEGRNNRCTCRHLVCVKQGLVLCSVWFVCMYLYRSLGCTWVCEQSTYIFYPQQLPIQQEFRERERCRREKIITEKKASLAI